MSKLVGVVRSVLNLKYPYSQNHFWYLYHHI